MSLPDDNQRLPTSNWTTTTTTTPPPPPPPLSPTRSASSSPPVPDDHDPTVFDRLPVELLLRVFAYLSPRELVLHAAPVCRDWHRLTKDPLLWTQLDLSFYNGSVAGANYTLCRLIKGAPLLKSLNISGWSDIDYPEVATFSSFIPDLQEIHLGFCHNIDAAVLGVLSEKCPKLKVVNLEGCRGTEGVTNEAIEALCSRLRGLERLNVSHCSSLTDEFVVIVARSVDALKSLNADGIPWLTDLSLSILTSLHSSSLVELRLDGEELTDDSILSIGHACFQLRVLDMSFCDLLSDISVDPLRRLGKLEHLRLKRGTGFSSIGLVRLFLPNSFGDSPFPDLKRLELPECSHLDDNGVKQIVKACGKKLEYLNLSWCWEIEDAGLKELVEGCPKMAHLEILGLKALKGSPLVGVLEHMRNLTYLGLQQCNYVDDRILMELVGSKPALTIINYYGERIEPDDSVVRFMADGSGVSGTRPDMLASPVKNIDKLGADSGSGEDAAKGVHSEAPFPVEHSISTDSGATSETENNLICDTFRRFAWLHCDNGERDKRNDREDDPDLSGHDFGQPSGQFFGQSSGQSSGQTIDEIAKGDEDDESGFIEEPLAIGSNDVGAGYWNWVSNDDDDDNEDTLTGRWDWVSI